MIWVSSVVDAERSIASVDCGVLLAVLVELNSTFTLRLWR